MLRLKAKVFASPRHINGTNLNHSEHSRVKKRIYFGSQFSHCVVVYYLDIIKSSVVLVLMTRTKISFSTAILF